MRDFQIRWSNFRSFEDTGWIKIKPLTIVIGANASGKTSLIAPLLMLKQTLASTRNTVAIKSQGPFFNGGSFQNLIFGHLPDEELGLGIRFHHHERNEPDIPEKVDPVGSYAPGSLELGFVAADEDGSAFLKRFVVKDIFGRRMLARTRMPSGSYTLAGPLAPKEGSALAKVARRVKPEHFLFSADGVLRERARERRMLSRKEGTSHQSINLKLTKQDEGYLNTLAFTEQPIYSLLTDLAYIGPLRERPRRLYETSGERPANVGVRGENAPEIIFRSRKATKALRDLNRWIGEFGFEGGLSCNKLCDGAFSLTLKRTETAPEVNCADTGFGLSQVLPLIVQSIYSHKDSLLIAEQPEIHLNPRCQTTLAELFVDTAKRDRGVLVETHSEHLLLRLRRLIAEGAIAADEVAIYFAEKIDGTSRIREVPIDSSGHIDGEDWPTGFFGEGLREALALAQAQSA